jgi:hypothetical protein
MSCVKIIPKAEWRYSRRNRRFPLRVPTLSEIREQRRPVLTRKQPQEKYLAEDCRAIVKL